MTNNYNNESFKERLKYFQSLENNTKQTKQEPEIAKSMQYNKIYKAI